MVLPRALAVLAHSLPRQPADPWNEGASRALSLPHIVGVCLIALD